jgi:hypothetical protein
MSLVDDKKEFPYFLEGGYEWKDLTFVDETKPDLTAWTGKEIKNPLIAVSYTPFKCVHISKISGGTLYYVVFMEGKSGFWKGRILQTPDNMYWFFYPDYGRGRHYRLSSR